MAAGMPVATGAFGGSAPLNFFCAPKNFVAPRKVCFKHIVKAKIVPPKNVLCPTKSSNLATGLVAEAAFI